MFRITINDNALYLRCTLERSGQIKMLIQTQKDTHHTSTELGSKLSAFFLIKYRSDSASLTEILSSWGVCAAFAFNLTHPHRHAHTPTHTLFKGVVHLKFCHYSLTLMPNQTPNIFLSSVE